MLRTSLCDRLGIDALVICAPFGPWEQVELAAAVCEAATLAFGPAVVSFHLAVPADLIARAHDAGIVWLQQVVDVYQAEEAAAAGADVIIAQGGEGGGNGGFVSTMVLVPQVVDIAGEIPVMAAGGIADGRGLAAALALGAQGACLGTRFLASTEMAIASEWKQRILNADALDTVKVTNSERVMPPFSRPHRPGAPRCLRTPLIDQLRDYPEQVDDAEVGRQLVRPSWTGAGTSTCPSPASPPDSSATSCPPLSSWSACSPRPTPRCALQARPPCSPDARASSGGLGHPAPADVWHGARIRGQPLTMDSRSVGVEEEFLLVEPDTGRPKAVAGTVLQAAGPEAGTDLEGELQQQQLETNSRPCQSLEELHRELRRCRAAAATAAGRAGAQVVALGTSPLPVEPEPLRTSRYERLAELFGLTAHEQLTCGFHVHVGISDADEGVAVLDRAGTWLATLLALSANSPFWQGRDSEYASFRYQVWGRWPSSGPAGPFGTSRAYRETIEQMVGSGTLIDPGMVYFDARLSDRYPTLEIRIADVCLRAEDAVLIAALARALVETEARSWREGQPASPTRAELLRLAAWRASRSGLDDTLLHPVTGKPEPATTVVGMLLDHCRDALSDTGDADAVAALLTDLLARGNGASFQRSAYRRSGRLPDVINGSVTVTGSAG